MTINNDNSRVNWKQGNVSELKIQKKFCDLNCSWGQSTPRDWTGISWIDWQADSLSLSHQGSPELIQRFHPKVKHWKIGRNYFILPDTSWSLPFLSLKNILRVYSQMEINTGFAEERPWRSLNLDNWFFFFLNRILSSNEILLRALIHGKQTKVKLHCIKDKYVSGDLLIWPFLYIYEYTEAPRVSWNNLITTNLYHTPYCSF